MKKQPGDSGTCAVGRIPERKRVQAPFGAKVLSFVRFSPNDGFGPESASPSGLVLRGEKSS